VREKCTNSKNTTNIKAFLGLTGYYIGGSLKNAQKFREIPNEYDILITVTADLTLKYNILREYLLQLGHNIPI